MSLLKQCRWLRSFHARATGNSFETNLLGATCCPESVPCPVRRRPGLFVGFTVSTDELTKLIGLLMGLGEPCHLKQSWSRLYGRHFSAVHLDMQISGVEGEERLNDTSC